MADRLWITWEIQRRNQSLSAALDAELHELVCHGPAWKRYPVLLAKTVRLIRQHRPRLVFAQHPSVVLAALVGLIGKLTDTTVVIDAHNAGVFPSEGGSRWLNWVARRINSLADHVIVTNESLRAYLSEHGCEAFSIPDPVPVIACEAETDRPAGMQLVCVSSWASDEPYLEVIEAARRIDPEIRIHMTGNSKGRHLGAGSLPGNVVLTGFISRQQYDALLCHCDAVIVLTTREDCLVCGAYEGVAVEKPMLLSDSKALRDHFRSGCLYTDNSAENIASCITQLAHEHDQLATDIIELKSVLQTEMKDTLEAFEARL